MRGPATVLMTALAVATVVGGVHAAPCTAPTTTCAVERSLPATTERPLAGPAATQPNPTERKAFLALNVKTAQCMGAYAKAILRQGIRDEDTVKTFVIGHCGSEMHDWLQREEGATEDMASGVLARMAGIAIDSADRSSAPKPPQKPEKKEPQRPPADIQYDPQQEQRRGIFLSFHAQTVACMREAAVAGLRNGTRNRKDLSEFVAGICSGPLFGWLTAPPPRGEGMPEKQARAFVIAEAYNAINMALRGPDAIIVR